MFSVLALYKNNGVYLSKDEQMDEFLTKGFDLYLVENGERALLATPKDGFVLPRPSIEHTVTMILKG